MANSPPPPLIYSSILYRKSRPFFAADTLNEAVAMAALEGQPCRVVSLKCVVNFDQRKNRRARRLDIESDELILLRRPPFKLKRNVTTRQNDRAALRLADCMLIRSANDPLLEVPTRPTHNMLAIVRS